MRRRAYLGAVGVLTLSGLAGCGDSTDDSVDDTTPEPAATPAPTETESPTATPTEGIGKAGNLSSVSSNEDWFSGGGFGEFEGQVVTNAFELDAFTAFSYEHSGQRNYIAELINANTGDLQAVLANEIGRVSGVSGASVPAGSYQLDITADGEHSFTIGTPLPPESEIGTPPAEIQGQIPDVYGGVVIDGRVTIAGAHNGSENFIIEAYSVQNGRGFADAVIFNEIGEFEGSTTERLSGVMFFAVQADGAYALRIE
jgi:hypothetical protein